jgi:uncharacterized protein (TIGR02594 family)
MTNKAYELARTHIGTKEIVGKKHNPKVVKWFAEVGHSWVNDDETPWCAAFVGAMLKAGGYRYTGKLNARSYADTPSNTKVSLLDAEEGDTVVFERGNNGWSGHVAFFVRQTDKSILCLGGNQNNEVNEKWYGKGRLIGVYRPKPVGGVVSPPPTSTKPVVGLLSTLLTAIKPFFTRSK